MVEGCWGETTPPPVTPLGDGLAAILEADRKLEWLNGIPGQPALAVAANASADSPCCCAKSILDIDVPQHALLYTLAACEQQPLTQAEGDVQGRDAAEGRGARGRRSTRRTGREEAGENRAPPRCIGPRVCRYCVIAPTT